MSTTWLDPYPVHYPSPAIRYLCKTWWTCYSSPRHTWRNRCDSLLATESRLSVVPATIQEMLALVIRPVTGWRGRVPRCFGVPCRIGRATVWLPVQENPGQYRELAVLVLLPRQEVEDAPPFIHLGTQFLREYQARVVLDCSAATLSGQLIIP